MCVFGRAGRHRLAPCWVVRVGEGAARAGGGEGGGRRGRVCFVPLLRLGLPPADHLSPPRDLSPHPSTHAHANPAAPSPLSSLLLICFPRLSTVYHHLVTDQSLHACM